MDRRLKRVLAREGLIIIGLGVSGAVIKGVEGAFFNLTTESRLRYIYGENMFRGAMLFISWGYPIYLFIKFIIWAIKTLKEKET